MKRNEKILEEVLKRIEPTKEDLEEIKSYTEKFLSELKNNLKKFNINAEIFTGGSFAKGTVIKKGKYDIDIFIRYDKKYKNEELSNITKKVLNKIAFTQIHGSRDYFRVNSGKNFFIELIPVRKINRPEEYENITDLSYFHVKYINSKIKSKKILDEIKIAKAFCYANKCYGAESYISGFSGYSLELLVYYYKGFFNFIRAISKIKKEKEIIDIEKKFKNKKNVLIDLNTSKLNSPIILIDPTYKQRNALAALSYATYEKFKKTCIEFLKSPSLSFFEDKKMDLDKIKESALKNKDEFILLETETNKQEGDIAGSKLMKFYNHLEQEISKLFIIKEKGFNYNNKKSARYFFVAKNKGEIISEGPFLSDKKNVLRFKKEHKTTFSKNNKIYSRWKINFTLKEFVNIWKTKNKKKMRDMNILSLKEVK
ncbi:MAG TPA: nucleotidyltransferase domain-containing protein [Candidatus Pacearchaeota archaeon]|nr:nucleotidyltransferase domain-containing protein [Candidatus Pacearchaeota archaeon]